MPPGPTSNARLADGDATLGASTLGDGELPIPSPDGQLPPVSPSTETPPAAAGSTVLATLGPDAEQGLPPGPKTLEPPGPHGGLGVPADKNMRVRLGGDFGYSGYSPYAPGDALGQQMLFEGAPPLSIGRSIRAPDIDTVRRYTLSNGLVVNLIATESAAPVDVILQFRSGKIDDPAGKSGLTHFVEHLACPGATLVDPQARMHRAMENDALSLRAVTRTNITAFSMRGELHQAETIMARLGEIFRRPEIPEAIIEREKHVIASERFTTVAPPFIEFLREEFERFNVARWSGRSTVLGSVEDVSSFTRADVDAHWDSHLLPGNAEITLATRDFARLLPLLDKHLGSLPASEQRAFQERVEVSRDSEPRSRVLWHETSYPGAGVALSFPTVSEVSREGAAAYLAARILGRGPSALIFDKIRSEDGLIYGPAPELVRTPGGALAVFAFVLEDPRTVEQALNGIKQATSQLGSLEFVRNRMSHEYWNIRERPFFFLEGVADNLICFGKSLGMTEFQQMLLTVTPEEVCETARRVFDPRKATLAVYTNAPARALPTPWGS